MMRCKFCGAAMMDNDTFCIKCGKKVEEPQVCPACGEILRPGTKYCHKCGVNKEAFEDFDPYTFTSKSGADASELLRELYPENREKYEKEQEALQGEKAHHSEETVYSKRSSYAEKGNYVEKGVYAEEDDYEDDDAGDDGYEDDGFEDDGFEDDGFEDDDFEDDDFNDYDAAAAPRKKSILGQLMLFLFLIILGVGAFIGYQFWQGMEKPEPEPKPAIVSLDGGEADQKEEETSEQSKLKVQGAIRATSDVNIRDAATKDSNVLSVARTGDVYEYYELVKDSWYHIMLEDGSDAYVSASYVEKIR